MRGKPASVLQVALFALSLSGCEPSERSGVIQLPAHAPVARTTPSIPVVGELPVPGRSLKLAYSPVASELDDDSWTPLVQHLHSRLGLEIEPVSYEGYAEILLAVELEQVDLALLAPLSYVLARQERPDLEPLAQVLSDGKTSYSSYLFVLRGSLYRDPSDLAGARVAFVDEHSTSGFLLPYSMLLDHGVDPEAGLGETLFTGSHVGAFRALAEDRADAVASYADAVPWAEVRGREEGWELPNLRLLGNAGRIPLDLLCVGPGVSRPIKDALREELLSTNTAGAAGRSFFRSSRRIVGWAPASDDAYDEVRAIYERVSAHRGTAPLRRETRGEDP